MLNYAWMIPLLPLLAFVLQLLLRTNRKKIVVASIGISLTVVSFLFAVFLLIQSWQGTRLPSWSVHWLQLGEIEVTVGTSFAPLQLAMLIVVSLVSSLVQVYSLAYMRDHERSNTFFAYLSLFTFSMIGLVLSPNLLELYVFWELVGVCSFLLVGFYLEREAAKQAAKKAFIVTRIGDVGLFIAICLLFWQVGSFDLLVIQQAVDAGRISASMLPLIAILIFVGAVGKSGQFPLHIWLPDAMEGPTPVSALIHAATMVAAGVFLVAELYGLFAASSLAMTVVAYIGGFTALFAAIIALTQTDIKRILAYSTVSQLGYMMLGLGSLGLSAGVFHLFTHAFFKALLFLVAGAVIVLYAHEQNIRKMGGLFSQQRGLAIAFLIGALSISGIPPFSGFFSKDAIFAVVYHSGDRLLFTAALLAAFCTSFYMFRLYFLVFTGKPQMEQTTKLAWQFQFPIWVLAVLTVVAGIVPMDWVAKEEAGVPTWLPVVVTIIALIGIGLAYAIYYKHWISAEKLVKYSGFGYRFSFRKFYIDEAYQAIFVWSLKGIGWLLAGFERFVLGSIVQFIRLLPTELGAVGSYIQNGQVQRYVLVSVIGFLCLLLTLVVGRLMS
jgi:NADH-quinone oxidoreductase subunit L